MLDSLLRACATFWSKLNDLPPAPTLHSPPSVPQEQAAPPLRYLIEHDDQIEGKDGEIIEVGYDGPRPRHGTGIRYCNLFNQTDKDYRPYLKATDTADEYAEKVVDPHGVGWTKLLADQCQSAIAAGFQIIEWDNPDGYLQADVLEAVDYAQIRGLRVYAKNPLICPGNCIPYVKHKAVVGVIVERGAGSPADMDALRRNCGKPDLPIYFVAFRKGAADGRAWAGNTAARIKSGSYRNMGVTISNGSEYGTSADVLLPL